MAIHPGYMGVADIGGTKIRFADASITARQDVMIPDMVMGTWDRSAYNFGKVEIGGTISGPVTDSFAAGVGSVWNWATTRDECGALTEKELKLYYFCDNAASDRALRTFPNMLAQSMNFSCAAGDVAQFSMEVIGAQVPVWGNTSSPLNTVVEKLVTWDVVQTAITAGDILITDDALLSNVEFTIANNVEAVYAMNQTVSTGFYPAALVPGLRTITGSVSCYDPQVFDGVFGYNTREPTSGGGGWDADAGRAQIAFTLGATTITFNVQFHRIEPALGVGPIISTVGFTGVGDQPF